MEKIKRTLALCGVIAAFCLGSCISRTDELDLNKDISLDMQIGPKGLFIPLGSLDTLYLDSLIKVDGDDSALDALDDGLFGFTMQDSIKKVNVEIGAVSIDIEPPHINVLETSFDNPEVKDVEIKEVNSSSTIKIQKIDVSNLNNKLPSFEKGVTVGPFDVPGIGRAIPTIPVNVERQEMSCAFKYAFPDDVKKINKVWFGETKGSRAGQLLSLDVDLRGIYEVLTSPEIKITDLTISFPDNFAIAKDPNLSAYIPDNCVTIDGSTFSIQMTSELISGIGADHKLPVTFYVLNADFSDFNYEIDFSDKVKYELELSIGGIAGNTAKTFQVGVNLKAGLKMADIEAATRSKDIDLDEETITSKCDVTNLDGISKVNTITFDENESKLYMSISNLDIDPFAFRGSSSKIVIQFPPKYTFDTDYCRDENDNEVGTWSTSRLTLDADKVLGHTVCLKVKSLFVNETVDEETASITISTDVTYSGRVVVEENNNINLEALDVLTDKKFDISVWGKFVVTNAEIQTGEMKTEFKDSTEISINEKVDDALVMIKRIDLVNPASARINLKFSGVPQTIQELRFSRFTVEFPDFIQLDCKSNDARYVIDGNKLIINGALTSELHSEDGFTVDGLEIKGMYFEQPLETVDGYLVLENQKVRINGAVTVNEQTIESDELDVIKVTPTVSFDPINVKSVYGKVNPKIDAVHEEVELSLGDDTDFFKNEKNSLSLSDPQLTINLTSTVTIPINIDLKLSSLDSKGNYIAKDIAPDNGTIHLGKCDTLADSRTTTLVIYKNDRQVSTSQDTLFVRMSRLSELMSTIPDKIVFDLSAGADQSVNHFVDLTRELSVSGEYKVSIPLSFDSLYIEYSDTIKELGKDLEDVADKIEAADLQLLADVESTIPLGVKLSAKAYDKNWNEIQSIRIAEAQIKAGADTITKSTLALDLDVQKGGLERLESIVFTAACESGEGSSSIRKGQWLLLKKLRIKFPEGLKVDLTDTDDK